MNNADSNARDPLPFSEQNDSETNKKSIAVLLFLGIFGLITSFFSVFVATFIGITNLSIQNGATLLVLTLLIMIFLIIKSANHFFNDNKILAIIGLLLIILNFLFFFLKVIQFISIPTPF